MAELSPRTEELLLEFLIRRHGACVRHPETRAWCQTHEARMSVWADCNRMLDYLDDAEAVLMHFIPAPEAAIARIEALAQMNAISAHAIGHLDEQRRWLDLLAIIERTEEVCKRCNGQRIVPDFTNWDEYHGEPKPKPCPECTEDVL